MVKPSGITMLSKKKIEGFDYVSQDSNYFIFKATPGKWAIVAKYK